MTEQRSTISFLRDLIAFPTVSRDPNRALIEYCADYLKSIGAVVEIIAANSGDKANLYATIGPDMVPGRLGRRLLMSYFVPGDGYI